MTLGSQEQESYACPSLAVALGKEGFATHRGNSELCSSGPDGEGRPSKAIALGRVGPLLPLLRSTVELALEVVGVGKPVLRA